MEEVIARKSRAALGLSWISSSSLSFFLLLSHDDDDGNEDLMILELTLLVVNEDAVGIRARFRISSVSSQWLVLILSFRFIELDEDDSNEFMALDASLRFIFPSASTFFRGTPVLCSNTNNG
jgi:hypothetical protein